jgi:hypothetical protein
MRFVEGVIPKADKVHRCSHPEDSMRLADSDPG